MNDRQTLFENRHRIHTTALGVTRIERNINRKVPDLIYYFEFVLSDKRCSVERIGKNYYCFFDGIRWTIHANSFTIITARLI